MNCLRASGIFLATLALAATCLAQTKISGTVKCGKPDQFHQINIGDKPGHAYAISQDKCTWAKPMTINGIQTKEDLGTNFSEMTGNSAHGHGYVLGTMSNGDKFVATTESMDTYDNGKAIGTQGTWSFASGGTGSMMGVSGSGTYKGAPDAEGNMVINVEGSYHGGKAAGGIRGGGKKCEDCVATDFPGPDKFTFTECTAPGYCKTGNTSLLHTVAIEQCQNQNSSACTGDCKGNVCAGTWDSKRSNGLTVTAAVGGGKCTDPKQVSCDVTLNVAAGGMLACKCSCNPR